MYSDYKTTISYFIVIAAFLYSVYTNKPELVSTIVVPLIVMWIILKTNSKELMKDVVQLLKERWKKDV